MIETPAGSMVDKEHNEAPDYKADALLALKFFRSCSSNVEREMELICKNVSQKHNSLQEPFVALFREHASSSLIAIGLITFMQLGGGLGVDVETSNIFKA